MHLHTRAALLALLICAPAAQAAPDRSVSAGARIPADAFAFADHVSPCTHHIAVNGSDANSGTSVAAAWRTPPKAFGTLAAGQTACVHAGTYDAGTLDPVRAGTATAPIALVAAPGEARPVIRAAGDGPLLNFGSGDAYWVIRGLDLNKAQRGGAT